jgi:hypothetical protein
MNIESSNLTHEEYFHLNGALSKERTEQLITELEEAQAFDVREYASEAQEACAGFPEEDCLQQCILDLQDFAKRLRGENKKDLLMLVEALQHMQSEIASNAEYGYSKLSKIISTVKRGYHEQHE